MQQLYLIGNRIMNETQKEAVTSFAQKNGLSTLTFIPFDEKVIEADTLGETPLKHKEITAMQTIDDICDVLLEKGI
jgi:CO dehydrogenase nickel-insertion accessory protein CooC1